MAKYHDICPQCGFYGKPKKKAKGSIAIELVLWLCFLIPGLIYSLWRQGSYYKACPKCGSPSMIPINTPGGRKLAREFHGDTESQTSGVQHA